MPEFSSAFSALKSDRKLSKEELVRIVRFMIAAEYEAVQLYMQVADSIDDELSRAVLKDISDEELIHAGEFLRLLKHLSPNEEDLYKEGYREVEEIMEKLQKGQEPVETRRK